jgi:hypothetical protein
MDAGNTLYIWAAKNVYHGSGVRGDLRCYRGALDVSSREILHICMVIIGAYIRNTCAYEQNIAT